MIDRTKVPQLSPLALPMIRDVERLTLSNGIELIILGDSSHEVFRLDTVIRQGIWNQPQSLIASTMFNMMAEGTRRHTSEELAEMLDFYGAYSDFDCGIHQSEVSLFSMTKYAAQTIPQMGEMMMECTFPESELETYLRNKRQSFLVNRQKTGWLAQKEMMRVFWGDEHPYANVLKESDYDQVQVEMLHQFHDQSICAQKTCIFLTGKVTDEVLKATEQMANMFPQNFECQPDLVYQIKSEASKHIHITKDDAVQTSIRIAQKGVCLLDEQYPSFMLLNTVLGGYFGSRLMSKIREEKGYTYGIQSVNLEYPQGAVWFIATDVNAEVCQNAIDDIFKEIEKLRTQLVSEDELALVKNYLLGDIIREMDGVYAQNDSLKQKMYYGIDNSFYIQLIEKIKTTTPTDLLHLAQTYWNSDEMYVVTAGKK